MMNRFLSREHDIFRVMVFFFVAKIRGLNCAILHCLGLNFFFRKIYIALTLRDIASFIKGFGLLYEFTITTHGKVVNIKNLSLAATPRHIAAFHYINAIEEKGKSN